MIETVTSWYRVRTAELRQMKWDIRSVLYGAKAATERAGRAANSVEDLHTSLREVHAKGDSYRQSHDTLWRSQGYVNARHGHDSLVGLSATIARAPVLSILDPYSPAPRDRYAPIYRATTRDIEGFPLVLHQKTRMRTTETELLVTMSVVNYSWKSVALWPLALVGASFVLLSQNTMHCQSVCGLNLHHTG